jgi:hypothetical protein
MKQITLSEAFDYLRLCDGIILEGRLLEIFLIGLENDNNNEFAYFYWSEEIHNDIIHFEIVFKEGDNQSVLVDNHHMTLVNTEGEEEELILLRSWDVEHDKWVEPC